MRTVPLEPSLLELRLCTISIGHQVRDQNAHLEAGNSCWYQVLELVGSKPWTSHVTPGKSLRESLTQDALQEVIALQMLLCTRTLKYGRHLSRRSLLRSCLADS